MLPRERLTDPHAHAALPAPAVAVDGHEPERVPAVAGVGPPAEPEDQPPVTPASVAGGDRPAAVDEARPDPGHAPRVQELQRADHLQLPRLLGRDDLAGDLGVTAGRTPRPAVALGSLRDRPAGPAQYHVGVNAWRIGVDLHDRTTGALALGCEPHAELAARARSERRNAVARADEEVVGPGVCAVRSEELAADGEQPAAPIRDREHLGRAHR